MKRFVIERVRYKTLWNGMHPDPTRKEHRTVYSRHALKRKDGDKIVPIIFKHVREAVEYISENNLRDTDMTKYQVRKVNI